MVTRTHLRIGTHTSIANIWGSHGGDCGGYFPEYKVAQLDRNLPTFRRNEMPHFYGIWRRHVPSKHRQTSTRLYDVTTKKTTVLTLGPLFPKGTHFIKPVGLCYVSIFSYLLLYRGRKRLISAII